MASQKEKTTLTLDREVKRSGVAVLEELGLSLSTFVDMALRQTVREGRLPFIPSVSGAGAPRLLSEEEVMRRIDSLNASTPPEVQTALADLTPEDERSILEARDA